MTKAIAVVEAPLLFIEGIASLKGRTPPRAAVNVRRGALLRPAAKRGLLDARSVSCDAFADGRRSKRYEARKESVGK